MNTPTRALVLLLAAAGPAFAQDDVITGQVLPYRTFHLQAPITGHLRDVAVSFGDLVEKGQPLARLDSPDLDADRRRAEVGMDQARMHAKLAELHREIAEAEVSLARRQVDTAMEAAHEARAQLARAEDHASRIEELAKAGRAGSGAVDEAQRKVSEHRQFCLEVDQAIEAAESGAKIATLRANEADVEMDAARAEVSLHEIEMRLADERLRQSEMRSPFSGRVTEVLAGPGDTVREHETKILEIVDASRVRVRFELPFRLARKVRAGTPVELLGGLEPVRAEVNAMSGILDPQTGTMTGEVIVDNTGDNLLPGSLVRVAFANN